MTEWKLFDGATPHVSTFEFHEHRERAPHLEQVHHQPRLFRAEQFVRTAAQELDGATVSDLGCGDGGLLSLLKDAPGITAAWGYDFAPANAAGWAERGVQAAAADVFGADWYSVVLGDIAVMTEVLEHVADPHGVVWRLRARGVKRLVCSSPWDESPARHCPEHAWAWDMDGYATMVGAAGWQIRQHESVGGFQVLWAAASPD